MEHPPLRNKIHCAAALNFCRSLPSESVDLVYSSPPYFRLRDYQVEGQLGMELTPGDYIARLLEICLEFQRVLKPNGSLFLNLGDTYASSKCRPAAKVRPRNGRTRPTAPVACKSLMGIPWRFALRMTDEHGWILRNEIIWAKPNPKPNSVFDRFNNAHESIFFFTRSEKAFFDLDAIREPYNPETVARVERAMRQTPNVASGKRDSSGLAESPKAILLNMVRRWSTGHAKGKIPLDVWSVPTASFNGDHFAVGPEALCVKPILACCPPGGTVLDPFAGTGTTALVAARLGRDFLACELNPRYAEAANRRLNSP